METGETPAQAAVRDVREVREELGIEVAVGPLLVADWGPHPDEATNSCSYLAAGR